ncbi:MAG: ABC transporter substrate-binding protein [Oscillospiraceae bacterium]|nr:ABC transporter substrate-binding protein [Oscillospiraceae bacterium]
MNLKKLLALLLAAAMLMALAACSGSGDDDADASDNSGGDTVYNIGIIQLVEHTALDNATQGFEDALIDLLGEDNVTFNFQNAQGEGTNCVTIANSLVSEGVDLIMANATSALQAAAAATADIPVLGTSVTDYATALDISDWTGVVGNNVSGTSDLAPLEEQAELLAELCPVEDYPTVGLIYCSGEANSVYQVTLVAEYLEEMGYTTAEYAFADSNDIASVVTNACADCDVLYIPTDNTAADNTETINNIAEPAGIPIIAGEEGICQGCGIATLSISYYDIGYITGEMAYEILVNGADVSTMEVQYAPEVTPEYVAERCEALGITVPDGYTAIEAN